MSIHGHRAYERVRGGGGRLVRPPTCYVEGSCSDMLGRRVFIPPTGVGCPLGINPSTCCLGDSCSIGREIGSYSPSREFDPLSHYRRVKAAAGHRDTSRAAHWIW
jgi:hypothetical protein